MKLAILILIFTSYSFSAIAGIPVQVEKTCPIGAEKFKTTSTASCSYLGYTMSLQPITSCDFITRLPQCPGNKLPLYKEFSEADIAEIETLMKTEGYQSAQAKSRYYLAAFIESSLSSKDLKTKFFLLQEGLWYTAVQSFGDPAYMTAYHETADATFRLDDFQDTPFWRGAEAFVYIRANNLDAARENIRIMETENENDNAFLANYIQALSYCINSPNDEEFCLPSTPLKKHEKQNSED